MLRMARGSTNTNRIFRVRDYERGRKRGGAEIRYRVLFDEDGNVSIERM